MGEKYLVFWVREMNFSIVSKSAIKSVEPVDETEAKFMGKWYPSIVIEKEGPTVERCFKEFLDKILREEAREDINKHVQEYAKNRHQKLSTLQDKPAEAAETPLHKVIAQEEVSSESPTCISIFKESQSERRMRKLEDDVKSLRRKIRKLEEKVSGNSFVTDENLEEKEKGRQTLTNTQLEKYFVGDNKLEEGARKNTVADKKLEEKGTGKYTMSDKDVETVVTVHGESDNIVDRKFDEVKVKSMATDKQKFKYLVGSFFKDEELKSSSRTGKKSPKSGDSARPPLNPNVFRDLTDAVVKYTSYDTTTFFKKFENVQKVLRR